MTTKPETPYPITLALAPTTNGEVAWLARHPDLPHCFAQGETAQEALTNLEEVRDMVLEHLRAQGITPPPPGSSAVTRTILDAAHVGE